MGRFECGICGKVSHAKPCDCRQEIEISAVSNYYGTLVVGKTGGRCWWRMNDCETARSSTIPESLYHELVKFQTGEDDDAT